MLYTEMPHTFILASSATIIHCQIRHKIKMMSVKQGTERKHFTVHNLRWNLSTLLNEAEFNTNWIEKYLAHEQRRYMLSGRI
jgi:integrase